jgi:hypothetical protein
MFMNPSHEYCIKCLSRFNVHDMIDHRYDMKMYSMKYECIMCIYMYIYIIYIYMHICIHNYIYIYMYIYISYIIYIYYIYILYIYYYIYYIKLNICIISYINIMCKWYKCVVHHELEAIWDPTVSLTRSTLSTLSTAFSLDSSSFSFRPKLFALKADRHRKENSWDDMLWRSLMNLCMWICNNQDFSIRMEKG